MNGTFHARLAACLITGLIAAAPACPAAAQGTGPHVAPEGGAPPQPQPQSPRLVAYFTQWGIYGAGFLVRDVAASGAAGRLTHINYAFGNVAPDPSLPGAPVTCQSGDPWADYQKPWSAAESVDGQAVSEEQPLRGNFQQLRQLKLQHPRLKLMVALGGWTWSAHFSNAALSDESRRAFVRSCVNLFIRGLLPHDPPDADTGSAWGVFDGIDIDWEYPGQCGNSCGPEVARPEDTRNFTLLLQEFRRQLDDAGQQHGRRYQLSIAAGAAPATLARLELAAAARSLDFINLMTYDYHGAWETGTNLHSALLPSPRDPARAERLSTLETVLQALAAGVPRRQLLIGVPAYSRGWRGVPARNRGLYQPGSVPADWSPTVLFRDARALHDSGRFARFFDPLTAGAWLYDPAAQEFWTYDDPQVMRIKGCFARSLGLGGVMMWELGGDTPDAALVNALWAALAAPHGGTRCLAP
jgi:chitinase